MTKLREPLTVEHVLSQVINKLEENEVKNITNKSISHFRKCSDPDDKDHNLHLSDAIKIDVLSLKSQNRSPFLDNMSLIIESEFINDQNVEDVSRILNLIGGRIGNLMDTAEKALHPDGPMGMDISKLERDNVFNAISEVEEKIAKLKISLK